MDAWVSGEKPANTRRGGGVEASLRWIASVGSGNGEYGAFVNVSHEGGLPAPVLLAVLDDAKTVDPQVLDTEIAANLHRILEALGKFFDGDSRLQVVLQTRLPGLDDVFARTPAVAEANVGFGMRPQFEQESVISNLQKPNPLRQWCGRGFAFRMAFTAHGKPRADGGGSGRRRCRARKKRRRGQRGGDSVMTGGIQQLEEFKNDTVMGDFRINNHGRHDSELEVYGNFLYLRIFHQCGNSPVETSEEETVQRTVFLGALPQFLDLNIESFGTVTTSVVIHGGALAR